MCVTRNVRPRWVGFVTRNVRPPKRFLCHLEKRRRGAVRIAVRAHRLVWNFVPTLPGSHHTRVRSTVLEAVMVL